LTSYETAKQLTPYPFPADFLQGNDGNFKESVQLDNQKFTIVPCHFLDSCTSIASLGSAMKKLCASIPSLGGSKVDELIQNKDVTADKKKDTFTQNEDTPVSKASKPALNTNKWINWQAIITNKVLLFSLIMAALFGGLKASNLV